MGRIFDVEDLVSLPREFIDTFKPSNIVAKGYKWWDLQGDSSAFFALFFDNLATQLSLAGMAIGAGFESEFFYTHVMGGVGVSIFLGNLYYTFQASKVAMRTGNMDTCAQPYGVNTPGAIAKTFGVLVPSLYFYGGPSHEAMEKAWSLACAANFVGGFLELLGAFIAPLIKRNVPTGALLAPIGAVGLTWLGLNPIVGIIRPHITYNATVGFVPLVVIWTGFFGGVSFGKVPAAGVAGLVGVILAWLSLGTMYDPLNAKNNVEEQAEIVGFHGLKWALRGGVFGRVFEQHLSLVLGLACTNFIGTYACVLSAKKQGDVYSPMESMIVDGIGSMIGACFGSPYGTTVYIGHVAYKKMGAKRGYSLLNGVLYLIFGLIGLQALIDALVPHECVLGIIVVIGFAMATQCIESVPRRWIPCVLVGMMLGVTDLASKGWSAGNQDISFLMNGYIWISFFYTFVLMMLTDRWFMAAAGIFLVMAFASLTGLIHAASMGLPWGDNGSITSGEANLDQADGKSGAGVQFVGCYVLCGVFCILMFCLQKRGLVKEAETEDFREIQANEDKSDDKSGAKADAKAESKPAVQPTKIGDDAHLFPKTEDNPQLT